MFAGYGNGARREEEEPAAPPASEPFVPGVASAADAPFYWTHEACGTQRLVDPATEQPPYRCVRCQPNWTRRDVLLRGRFS